VSEEHIVETTFVPPAEPEPAPPLEIQGEPPVGEPQTAPEPFVPESVSDDATVEVEDPDEGEDEYEEEEDDSVDDDETPAADVNE
jgi:hypothetical protein